MNRLVTCGVALPGATPVIWSAIPLKVPPPPALPPDVNLAIAPALKCANEDYRNHTPIINATNLAGDNSVTFDKPIGDKKSSPDVIKR